MVLTLACLNAGLVPMGSFTVTAQETCISNLQIASINGFNSVDMNVGTMDNWGFELGLNATL